MSKSEKYTLPLSSPDGTKKPSGPVRLSLRTSAAKAAARAVTAFGPVLLVAIKKEFRTQKAFALVLGVSETLVSQYVNGTDLPNKDMMVRIVACFWNPSMQHALQTAWARTCVPMPDPLQSGRAALEIVDHLHDFKGLSSKQAAQVIHRFLSSEEDPAIRHELMKRLILLLLRLTRGAEAMKWAKAMETEALAANDPERIVAAQWKRLLVLYNYEEYCPKRLYTDHGKVELYALAVKPHTGAARQRWWGQFADLQRDKALFILRLHEGRPVTKELLKIAFDAADQSVSCAETLGKKAQGMEVRARVELAMARPDLAADTLDAIEENGIDDGHELREKVEITRARLHLQLADGEGNKWRTDLAEEILGGTVERCFKAQNLRHHAVASRLLLRIRTGG